MIGKQVGEGKPVPMAAAKAVLQKREKAGELHYEQKLALDYVRKFAPLSDKDAEKILEEFDALKIPRWKPRFGVKIVDLMPQTEEEVKAIFSKESISLKKEEITKVLEVLLKYR